MAAEPILTSLPKAARILILRLRSIGDIVLLTPALHLLKEWRPDLRLSVVVESRFRELLEGNPDVEETLGPGQGEGWERVTSRWRAARELRKREFALCLNLHGGPTSAFLTLAAGAKASAAFFHFRPAFIYRFLIPDAKQILGQPTIHTAEHQASAFFHLGLPRCRIPRARLFVSQEKKTWWSKQRAALGIGENQPYAIVHPAALFRTKEWAPENFAALGACLERERSVIPIYSCGPGEFHVLDAVERASGAPIRRLANVDLGQFAAAIDGARLFVGNDSGPAHMAAALGRPLVVIFGSSSSPIWGPWPRDENEGTARVVQNHYDCNPCPGDRCYRYARPECILSVRLEQVREAVDSLLAADVNVPPASRDER